MDQEMDPALERIMSNAGFFEAPEESHPERPFSRPHNNAGPHLGLLWPKPRDASLHERFGYEPSQTSSRAPVRSHDSDHYGVGNGHGSHRPRSLLDLSTSQPATNQSRISLSSLAEPPSACGGYGTSDSGYSNDYLETTNRNDISILDDLRSQPRSTAQLRPVATSCSSSTHFAPRESRLAKLQPPIQQITPPFTAPLHTPPRQRDSSPPVPISSPTNDIVARRGGRGPFSFKSHPEVPQHKNGKRPSTIQGPRRNLSLDHAPPFANGIQLVLTHELPDRFRQLFLFPVFNAVQSKTFPAVYKSDDNVVVSSPTGSGKTVILELAILRLLESDPAGQHKIVYQAPTKSLCSERARDWGQKFASLNMQTAELTGDTDISEMRKVGNATIIVTTPEKWDSITRKWKDHIKLLQLVKLFLIDEVHILKDIRGATLEAVVSRMKSIGANVRFVALSATVPNSHDLAVWLGKNHTNRHLPAHRETFGEEFRPVKLQKHVKGIDSNTQNDFAFDSILDTKLPDIIVKYTHKKPILVFCFTRKSCEVTAAKLAEWWSGCRPSTKAWPAPTKRVPVSTKDLQDLTGNGVAYHHAGLEAADRMTIEKAYLEGTISVICCTSTLAVGINLPCHLVILKGTIGYQDGQLCEYSDLEVMQMLGRAGRPQFDDSGIAVIMTRKNTAEKYAKMMSGQDVLESTLHLNLIEHLNSEVSLGTVHDVYSAKQWAAGTFLAVRMKQNPAYYRFTCDTGSRDPDERLEQVCERDIKSLQDSKLITSTDRFTTTAYGEAMCKYMVKYETMLLLLSVPEHAKIGQILSIVSMASEFKDLKLKAGEKSAFKDFNKSAFIRYPVKENIMTTAHKVLLTVQVQLGGVDLPNSKDFNKRQYLLEKSIIFDRINRLVRCIVDCKAYDGDALAVQNALELSRSIAAGYWEHLPSQLRQIPSIGAAAVRKLVSGGIKSIENLREKDAATIERIMSRNPPFGHKLLSSLRAFPKLILKTTMTGNVLTPGRQPRIKIKATLGFASGELTGRSVPLTFMAGVSSGKLAHLWRGTTKKIEKGFDLLFLAELENPTDAVGCFLACDEIVGTIQSAIIVSDIPASAFPPKPIAPPEDEVVKSVEATDSQADDGFGWDDVDENDLLEAATAAEGQRKMTIRGANEAFLDIDELTAGLQPDQSTKWEPEQLPNGKWKCNHACSGGVPLRKSGIACSHKCCKEGLGKPRKIPKKANKPMEHEGKTGVQRAKKIVADSQRTKLELKRAESPLFVSDEMEAIDMTEQDHSPQRTWGGTLSSVRRQPSFKAKPVEEMSMVELLEADSPIESGTFLRTSAYSDSEDLPPMSHILGVSSPEQHPSCMAPSVEKDPFGDLPDDFFYAAEAEAELPHPNTSFMEECFDMNAYSNAETPAITEPEPATSAVRSWKRGLVAEVASMYESPVAKKGKLDDIGASVAVATTGVVEISIRSDGLGAPELSIEPLFPESPARPRPAWLAEFDPDLIAEFEGFVEWAAD